TLEVIVFYAKVKKVKKVNAEKQLYFTSIIYQ
ncbi:MAG: hypothetical protein ACI9K1_002441, partial [Arcticibacterium sp.]